MLCDSLFLADEGIFDDLAATKLLITGFYLLWNCFLNIWNASILYQIELAKMLLKEGQNHLFDDWSDADTDVEKKKAFFDQVWDFT
jgi:hypothetical protein